MNSKILGEMADENKIKNIIYDLKRLGFQDEISSNVDGLFFKFNRNVEEIEVDSEYQVEKNLAVILIPSSQSDYVKENILKISDKDEIKTKDIDEWTVLYW